jgi:hypothetical protein
MSSAAGHPALRSASRAELARLAERVRPVALADEQVLPVLPALQSLMPWSGLARGVTVGCSGTGATSLTLALVAGASAAGAWTVAVGLPDLGLAAAAEVGVDLSRLALVDAPVGDGAAGRWAEVVGALIGAFDLILLGPTHTVRLGDARRLSARARERGTTLLLTSAGGKRAWPEGPDLQLTVTQATWHGLGQGHGHLRARQVHLETTGRRRAARPRSADLWLLDPDGQVAAVEPTATVMPLHSGRSHERA